MKALTDDQRQSIELAWRAVKGDYPNRTAFASEEALHTFSRYYAALKLLVRVPLSRRKEDVLREALADMKLNPSVQQEMIHLVMSQTENDREVVVSLHRPKMANLRDTQWRISVVISTSLVRQVLQPVVSMRLLLADGTDFSFEMTLQKFHMLRYNIAKLLKEMETLDAKYALQ